MVEWKQMWEVTTWDKKFSGVDKFMQPNVIKYHYFLANELTELERPEGDVRILYTTDKVAFTNSSDVDGMISEGEIVAIPWGGNVTIKYYKGKFVTADNRIATSNNPRSLSNKFLYYWMLSQKEEIAKFYRGAGIQHPSMYKVLTMPVPIPSISKQTRIVGILDTFTASIENLKEQIKQRRKQYEHYRDQLLDLEGKEGVEMKTIGQLAKYRRGSFPQPYGNKEWYDGEGAMPFVQVADVEENSMKLKSSTKQFISRLAMPKSVYAPIGTILVTLQGSIGKVAITQYESYVDRTLGVFEGFTIDINKKYFAHQLEKIFAVKKEKARGGTIKTITKEEFTNFLIPLPSHAEQSRIVSILDTFEASISNLEAQLKEREKQYEYYRNKLLTFE